MKSNPPCPCGSGRHYADCCEPLHQGQAATTAQMLMRSRYSAYVLGLKDYLRQSWHPDTCPADLGAEPGLRWLGLKVGPCEGGGEQDQQGSVSFVARYRLQGRGGRMQERSRFVRYQGRWVYLDGEQTTD